MSRERARRRGKATHKHSERSHTPAGTTGGTRNAGEMGPQTGCQWKVERHSPSKHRPNRQP